MGARYFQGVRLDQRAQPPVQQQSVYHAIWARPSQRRTERVTGSGSCRCSVDAPNLHPVNDNQITPYDSSPAKVSTVVRLQHRRHDETELARAGEQSRRSGQQVGTLYRLASNPSGANVHKGQYTLPFEPPHRRADLLQYDASSPALFKSVNRFRNRFDFLERERFASCRPVRGEPCVTLRHSKLIFGASTPCYRSIDTLPLGVARQRAVRDAGRRTIEHISGFWG